MAWLIATRQPKHVALEVPASRTWKKRLNRDQQIGCNDSLHPEQPTSGIDFICLYSENIS